jgi:hypothetical protein
MEQVEGYPHALPEAVAEAVLRPLQEVYEGGVGQRSGRSKKEQPPFRGTAFDVDPADGDQREQRAKHRKPPC